MVRVNLINPKYLADQHLIAEYDEILMLLGYVRRYPLVDDSIPKEYTLGKGHIKFFKNKLGYLKKRHEAIKTEMTKRGFKTNITINLKGFHKEPLNDWKPKKDDLNLIKTRIIEKINLKPEYYRYYGEHKTKEFFVDLIRKSDIK